MDRNQKAKDDFAAARARHQFNQAVAAGQAAIRDRFGHGLKEGDLVLYSPEVPIVFQITKVAVPLDLNIPAGVMQLEMKATVPQQVQANAPLINLVKIGERPAAGAAAVVSDPDAIPTAIPDEDDRGSDESTTDGPVDAPALGSDEP